MRTFIAVLFSSEAGAYEGLRALQELHGTGTITVYETAVVEREIDGAVVSKFTSQDAVRRTGIATVLGALVGALGGPVGVVLGATAGGVGRAVTDAVRATIGQDYIDQISKHLGAGGYALLAEVHEDRPAVIDARMIELGGKLLREKRTHFFEDMLDQHAQARRAEIAAYDVARDSERAERQANYLDSDLRDAPRIATARRPRT